MPESCTLEQEVVETSENEHVLVLDYDQELRYLQAELLVRP